MPKRLGRVAASLGVSDQFADTRRGGRTDHRELDHDLLEVGRRIVDVVFLGVPEGRPDVGRRILDRDLVEWREPRQLGQQSKRGRHHQVLQRRRAFLGTATRQRLVGLDHELTHPAFEVDIVENARDRPRGRATLLRRPGAHLLPQADDLVHLPAEIDAAR
jgi:hypothetical protein